MKQYTFTAAALEDPGDAVDYLDEATGSMEAGERLLVEMQRVVALLAANPMMGRPRHDISPGLRSHVAGAFTLYYRVEPQYVAIQRVLHQRRNVRTEFGLEPDESRDNA